MSDLIVDDVGKDWVILEDEYYDGEYNLFTCSNNILGVFRGQRR